MALEHSQCDFFSSNAICNSLQRYNIAHVLSHFGNQGKSGIGQMFRSASVSRLDMLRYPTPLRTRGFRLLLIQSQWN
jgi:hypothetical protein